MIVKNANLSDFDKWIALAREIEPLFGHMTTDASIREGLRLAILSKTAFHVSSDSKGDGADIKSGIVISQQSNEIIWFAVFKNCRDKGYGHALLDHAIQQLDIQKDIFVQTFDKSVPEGFAARTLYKNFGFTDYQKGDPNPAGFPTMIMRLDPADR